VNNLPQTKSSKQNILLWLKRPGRTVAALILVGIAVIVGVWQASRISVYDQPTPSPTSTQQATISRISFGSAPMLENGQTRAVDVQEKKEYMSTDNLALRVISDTPYRQTMKFTVRLLDQFGKTIELEPSQVTLPTGDSHFCCWHIEKSGSYTLQVFRPDNALSSFNFRIRKAVTSIPKSFLKK